MHLKRMLATLISIVLVASVTMPICVVATPNDSLKNADENVNVGILLENEELSNNIDNKRDELTESESKEEVVSKEADEAIDGEIDGEIDEENDEDITKPSVEVEENIDIEDVEVPEEIENLEDLEYPEELTEIEELEEPSGTDEIEPDEEEHFIGGYNEVENIEIDSVDETSGAKKLLKASSVPQKYIQENLPPLMDQGSYGTCWAITSLSLAAIDRLRDGCQDSTDYSEIQLAYFTYKSVVDPLGGLQGDINSSNYNFTQAGGNPIFSSAVLANWVGAADESIAPYSKCSYYLEAGLDDAEAYNDSAHLADYYMINIEKNPQNAKKLIMKYGALTASMYAYSSEASATSAQVYNKSNNCYYMPSYSNNNHSVTIVGWDDNFSKENFSTIPEGDGAWLIRNSWRKGTGTDEDNCYFGYFWMSYYDKSLSDVSYAFDFQNSNNYEFNYQYDGAMKTGVVKSDDTITAANVFDNSSEDFQAVRAVSFYTTSANVSYSIEVYADVTDKSNPKSGRLCSSSSINGSTTYPGYYTIELDTPVIVSPSSTFAAVVSLTKDGGVALGHETSDSGSWYRIISHAEPNQSLILEDNSWVDFGKANNANFRIKAFADTKVIDETISLPTQNTYMVGDEINLSGGMVLDNISGDTYALTEDMIPDFDTSTEGRFEFDVDTGYSKGKYEIVVSDYPKPEALSGDTIDEVVWNDSEYGSFSPTEDSQLTPKLGRQTIKCIFTPKDEKFVPIEFSTEIVVRMSCTVSFDMMGYGNQVPSLRVGVGDNIDEVIPDAVDGYSFGGWYLDNPGKLFDFEKTQIESDIVLKALWLGIKETGFSINSIQPQIYTGKEIKPAVTVKDEITGKVLIKGTDYTVSYSNNINCNSDNNHPSIIIKGKGNYSKNSEIVGFEIVPKSIGDGDNVSSGISLSYKDTLSYNSKSTQKALNSVKYNSSLKKGRDYTVTLTDEQGVECIDALIPKKGSGKYILTIYGCGNYEGTIIRSINVVEAKYNMTTTSVRIDKSMKNVGFDEYSELISKSADEIKDIIMSSRLIEVKSGGQQLEYGRDYQIVWPSALVGEITLKLEGCGEYFGQKNVKINVLGRTFSDRLITVDSDDKLENYRYTGFPIWVNGTKLYYKGETDYLINGRDYTVSYKNNINVGTATVTFTGKKESGFTGKFSKTFKILPAQFEYIGTDEISVPYSKNRAKPSTEIDGLLRNSQNGRILERGKDYTISYQNNANVRSATDVGAPTMIIKGKGNYSGTRIDIPFTIDKQKLDASEISIAIGELKYNSNERDKFNYKPSVLLKDGKSSLTNKRDYRIEYLNNSQPDVKNYIDNNGISPKIRIYPIDTSNYMLDNADGYLEYTIPVYMRKLTASNTSIIFDEESYYYNGSQICPKVYVTYKSAGNSFMLKESNAENGYSGDYMVSYGPNIWAGSESGTVIIKGISPKYGGTVKVRFRISGKKIKLSWF